MVRAVASYCILSFLDKDDRDFLLLEHPEIFAKWFEVVSSWKESDLAKLNRVW